MNPDRALDFIDFVQERHRIWERRQAGLPSPWTTDPVLATRKFTCVFRVLDPGSQFVLTDLWEPRCSQDAQDSFLARCFLYRHTNLPSAWTAFKNEFAGYPWALKDYDDLLEFWRDYRADGNRVFSGAYMIYPQSSVPGTDKIESVIRLTQRLFFGAEEIATDFLYMQTQEACFQVLRRNKGVADFMSMQILTDYGYATEFREDEFYVPGPGTRKGAAVLGLSGEQAVEWAYRAVHSLPEPPLFEGRLPSRMDCGNMLCEYSKYVRLKPAGSGYAPAHPGPQVKPVVPPLW